MIYREIVVWGDGGFSSQRGHRAAPSSIFYRALKDVSRMLGTFPAWHPLHGQNRLLVLKINENYTSQMPSCWANMDDPNVHHPQLHPPLPAQVPPVNQRLRHFRGMWAVLQCPHCDRFWHRDLNACRYMFCIYIEINFFFFNIGISQSYFFP